ncbi:putative hydrolase or acyltransferase of alpha/beta superfamily [Candidatus Nitrososphaera evergladensis SR1]|uniref:Putative hydrolase or acyltransferase of alpha/beta superfamily n=1 Tax=Candidatus Nitrososphaera evergladensis SR1 TaxID=1459636 RepID=A0A075MSY1_9ARCH|nr:alpha/beta hydrolase [Candidatus Nitrososphaera evergladensis]AIF84290.1 putative hydrolase or acyltransferase of alpha/beta superfamily [Candidatus Nitrososphaera evergladensis SR1]
MSLVKVNDEVSLYVEDTRKGTGGKPTIVFIHGWPSHGMFEYQFMQLQKKGYRCIGMDLRGFGRSDKPWYGEYTYDTFADDIEDVMTALDLHGVTLVGFSMGGAIAMHHAAKYLSSGRISKVIFMGAAAPCFTKREDFPYGLDKSDCDSLIAQSLNDRAKMVHDFIKIFFRSEDSQSQETRNWLFAINMQASPYATVKCLEELRDADLRDDMRKISERKLPVAIFHGVNDKICPFDLANVMNRGIEGSRLVRFENSGHGLNIEEKEKANDELIKFVDLEVPKQTGK